MHLVNPELVWVIIIESSISSFLWFSEYNSYILLYRGDSGTAVCFEHEAERRCDFLRLCVDTVKDAYGVGEFTNQTLKILD